MRIKHILHHPRLGTKIKIVYERVTLTPFTTVFALVAIGHCLVQVALQSAALAVNARSGATLDRVIRDSPEMRGFAYTKDDVLYVCNGIPKMYANTDSDTDPTLDADAIGTCYLIAGPGSYQPGSAGGRRQIEFGSGAVNITDPSNPANLTELSGLCVSALNWPNILLHDARREDVSFLVFQVWLLGISIVTVLNESIPHLVTVLITHGLSSAWSVYLVSRTGRFENLYNTLVVEDACSGTDLIPNYWSVEDDFFIPILALNFTAFVVTSIVSCKLFNVYAQQTLKRVGASSAMNKRYSFILLFSVFLQLSIFFTLCSSALWVDTLYNGVLAPYATNKTVHRVAFTISCIVEFPWLVIGWNSFRREHRLWSITFLVIGMAIVAAWSLMFANAMYRWTFQTFAFFAVMTVGSFILLVATLGLALVCFSNFGMGLPQYLKSEDTFDESRFIPVSIEKGHDSRFFSVIFPDKRVPVDVEKAHYNPYKQTQRPLSGDSVIDIKAPDLDADNTPSTENSGPPYDSLLMRARNAPALRRFSTISHIYRLARRLSAPSVPDPGAATDVVPAMPKIPAEISGHDGSAYKLPSVVPPAYIRHHFDLTLKPGLSAPGSLGRTGVGLPANPSWGKR
ncbi:hypothetical protein M0805_005340 [Coniferiporia weirii]|nr:hypothetical protein M0805_005340 [Coniferiporia weirii]